MPICPRVHFLISCRPLKVARSKIFNPPAQHPIDAIIIRKGREILLGSIEFIHLLNKINNKNVINEASEHIARALFQNCCCAILSFEYWVVKRTTPSEIPPLENTVPIFIKFWN